jgi:hypothetical protein
MTEIEPVPRDFVTLRARIVERGMELPRRQHQVAAFVLDHPDEIAFATVASVAEQANVKPSTLVFFRKPWAIRASPNCKRCFARGCATGSSTTESASRNFAKRHEIKFYTHREQRSGGDPVDIDFASSLSIKPT